MSIYTRTHFPRGTSRKLFQCHTSAGSGDLFFDLLFQGCFLFTTVVATYTFLDLGGAQASLRFHDGLLAVHPLRLDPVQPGTLARQVADHDPYPAVLLRPPVVCLHPGPPPP